MKNFFCLLFLLLFTASVQAEISVRWPMPDWEVAPDSDKRMSSNQCDGFKKFATDNPDFKTDGLIVIKDGLVQYEYYDSKTTMNHPHALWSVSKTITGALMGIAESEGRIQLEESLSNYFPRKHPTRAYNRIELQNLLYMDSGFVWDEAGRVVMDNNLVNMLYGEGSSDMVTYALRRRVIEEGPQYQWTYSTGTPVITMGILRKIYGEQYDQIPWRNLFFPLNMMNTVFEKDLAGNFNGGAGVFSTPRDLAKIGYLYLNNGVWNNQVILSPQWIQKMLTPSPGFLSEGTKITNISEDGVFGGSMWLNQPVKKGYGKPYPDAPADMYLAIGYRGQLLIVLPTQKMILVRTGNDNSYNYLINQFVTRALACFHDRATKIGSNTPFNPDKIGLNVILSNANDVIEAGIIQASVAKNVCSCHFISQQDIPTCLARNRLSGAKYFTKISVRKAREINGDYSIDVELARFARLFKLKFGKGRKAVYDPRHPELGCTLI